MFSDQVIATSERVSHVRFSGYHRRYRLLRLFRNHPRRAYFVLSKCNSAFYVTLQIFFPRSIENEMTQRDQQLTHRRQRAQLAIWNRINARHRRTASDQSYISITRHSKAELDHFKVDPFPSFESTQTHSLGMHQSARVSLPGLPSYDAVAPRQSEGEQEPWPSIKVANLKHSVGPSISLQPNRRTVSGSIELGAVLTHNQVELIRAQSNRERGVSSLVHHWRSPIGTSFHVVCVCDVVG